MSDHPVQVKENDQKQFNDAVKIISWNRWLLTCLGIWPQAPSQFVFNVCFTYYVYHMFLEYVDLILVIDNLEQVIENLTENIALSEIFIRIGMLRRYNKSLGTVIEEVLKDFDSTNYKNHEEIQVFMKYNKSAKTLVKFVLAFLLVTVIAYFLKPISAMLSEGPMEENATVEFLLPYRFHLFYKINDSQTYTLTYLSQLPFLFVSSCGQVSADCLMVTLVFHVCGQMSILAMRISKINSDPDYREDDLRQIVKDHRRLLRMGNLIARAFSETLLGHLIGATAAVCILGYQILTCLAKGQNSNVMTFVTFAFSTLLVLYAHCTVGENLRTESEKVCNAFYNCDWYEMSTNRARAIMICMARSQKPLCLRAGKFGIFCLRTLTEVVKAAMSYLSVLRTLL